MKYNTLRLYLTIASVCVLGILSACSTAMSDQKSGPAILLESSTKNTQVISQAMSLALNGKKVSLTANAFRKSSDHTLEKKAFTGMNSKPADGLILGIPVIHRFSLLSSGSSCHLVYEKTGTKYPLNGINCKAL